MSSEFKPVAGLVLEDAEYPARKVRLVYRFNPRGKDIPPYWMVKNLANGEETNVQESELPKRYNVASGVSEDGALATVADAAVSAVQSAADVPPTVEASTVASAPPEVATPKAAARKTATRSKATPAKPRPVRDSPQA